MPKPDLVAYFNIRDFQEGVRNLEPHRWNWHTDPAEAVVENFSLATLEHLGRHGLQPSTSRMFDQNRKARVFESDFICYPWLIIEHKKSQRSGMFCYCQAANAASAALEMHMILAKYAREAPQDAHIPPVTTMTTVGREVRIWIAYVSNVSNDGHDCVRVSSPPFEEPCC